MTWEKDRSRLPSYRITYADTRSSGATSNSETAPKPSELSSTWPPQRASVHANPALGVRMPERIREGHEQYRCKWGGENPRR